MNNGKLGGFFEFREEVISNYHQDYDHAIEYAKEDLRQEFEAIRIGLLDWIRGRVEAENQIPAKWQEEQEKRSIEIKEIIFSWLQQAPENIESQKAKAEADYEKQLEEWKQAKAAYQAQYEAVAAKQLKLQEKIAQLEKEKSQLKGLFIKKKKEELGTRISMLKVGLSTTILPQDPGEPPIKEQEKIQIAKAIFPVFQECQLMREELARTEVGEKVYFGKYPYAEDGNAQEIQWRVLDKKENSVLLLTEYGIDAKSYHENAYDITWENCTLRQWLNEEFLNEAFSDYEKKLIQTTNVDNSRAEGYSRYNTNGGNNTEDKVFLLSYKEAFEDYFSSDEERICMPTAYAVRSNRYVDEKACSWWLRSPGINQDVATNVFSAGSPGYDYVYYDYNCVRPALWINLESDIFQS